MASYNELNALIDAYINRNGVQAITGQILNGVLKVMVEQLGRGYAIMGVADLTTDPGTPDAPESWFASTPGTYTNFGGLVVADAEFAIFSYTPQTETWEKTTLTEGIKQIVCATHENGGHIPNVEASYEDGVLTLDFYNLQGLPGENATIDQVTAELVEDGGQPDASVTTYGIGTTKSFAFTFKNLKGDKGETGVTSVVATVDNTTGTPACTVSLVGQQLTLAFTGLKGAQGDTGSSVDYPFTIVNNLTTDDATQALSAAQGVVLDGKVTQLEAKVDDLSTGKYYGYFAKEEDLPEADVDGFAYVGEGPTYTIYNLRGGVWTSSDITVNQSPIGNEDDIDQNEDGKLQFANRVYNAQQPNGMGYKILRKDATFASQVTETNTIYEIRYDFSLSADVSIPANCELRFDGGRIVGGGNTITFNNTLISGNAKFSGCEFAGTILNGEVLLSWFTEGMSSSNDYSVDHTSVLVSAMKLASKNNNGWLNLERIPICIKQTIIITDEFGKIGMRGGEIFFVSTEDEQALFDYQERTSYSGSYSPIIDCKFTDVGDNYNTCVIKKTSWSDTAFTYWRDIRVSGFTGYFFVTNSYIQEVTFTNISVSGAGFFSTNSDGLYDGNAGSGNIIHFLNCNCNGGELNSKTSIRAIYDLSNCIEASLNNIVCQGRIGGSNIYPAYISHTSNITSGNRCNAVFDGFWVEYINGSGVISKIKCENVSANVEVRKSSVSVFDIVHSNVNLIIKSAGGGFSKDILEGLTIDNTSNVTLSIDSALYGETLVPSGDYGLFKNYIDRGILRVLRNSTPPYGAGVTQTGVSISLTPENEADLMQEYVNTITKSSITSRPFIHYLSSENNIPVLTIEQVGTGNYYEFPFLTNYQNYLGGNIDTYVSRSIWQEIIYRVTVLIDVTSSNLSEVYCLTRGLSNQGGGALDTMIEPTVGMLAGESTGWVRTAFCGIRDGYALTSGGYISMRNCKLEIARLRIARRNVSINDDVYIDSLGALQTMRKMPRCFYMPIEAASDNLSEMSKIVEGGGFTVETPKNVYKYINGHLQAMLLPTGGKAGDRPTLGANDIGKTYFDTSLGCTIVWNGTSWVNLDGTELQWVSQSVGTLTTYYIMSVHTQNEGVQIYSTAALASPYLDVSGITKIRISVMGVASASTNYGIAFYDANKAVLAGKGMSFTNQAEDNNDVREITLPSGCSYVRTCIKKDISQTITFLTWVGN